PRSPGCYAHGCVKRDYQKSRFPPQPAQRGFFAGDSFCIMRPQAARQPLDPRMISITQRLAEELSVKSAQVDAAIALLDEGATVPFISRYRKEVTGGLDDMQMRTLEDRLRYLREMEERRAAILQSIQEQGKLTPELAHEI